MQGSFQVACFAVGGARCDEGGCHATEGSVQRLRHPDTDVVCAEWEGLVLLIAALFHRGTAAAKMALEVLLTRTFPGACGCQL